MKNVFLFDVESAILQDDNILTNNKKDKLYDWLKEQENKNFVYFVSTQDAYTTRKQVGSHIFKIIDASFNCDGNELYLKNEIKWSNRYNLQEDCVSFLLEKISRSTFTTKMGRHIENNTAILNFSIPGNDIDNDVKVAYNRFDTLNNDRKKICSEFNKLFGKKYVAKPYGKCNIKITLIEHDRAKITKFFDADDKVYFFENTNITLGYNDDLKEEFQKNGKLIKTFNVSNFNQLFDVLNKINVKELDSDKAIV